MTSKEYNKAVELYTGRLLRFARKLVQDTSIGEDVVQDCFMHLWENKAKVELEKAKSWLFTTAYRDCLKIISKQNRRITDFKDEGIENPSPDLKEVLERCLVKLPEMQRSILMLRDYEGYDYKEIGEILELNESQVKVYLFRARGKMKELIKDLNLVI